MAIRGQRFELDLDAPNFTANIDDTDALEPPAEPTFVVKEIQEHDFADIPPAPKQRSTSTGFPQHRSRRPASAFKHLRQQQQKPSGSPVGVGNADRSQGTEVQAPSQVLPSDRAILQHVGKKHGHDFEAQQRAEISEENKQRIAAMSRDDIEQARAELMQSLNPAFIERLMKRSHIEDGGNDEQTQQTSSAKEQHADTLPAQLGHDEKSPHDVDEARVHFPLPPRSKSDYVPLDPSDPDFQRELKTHYFPDTPHDPSSLSWLQDPTDEEETDSPYNPSRVSYAPSAIRFDFTGKLIPPKESLEIDVSKGLHHHGDAPSSAGYTIPELAILSRSTMPSQRCVAYQVMGRILYRLGRGDYGAKGTELHDGLWDVTEKERIVEVMMVEADRAKGHVTAKTCAVEALWLWRKGGGGERGILKPGQTRVP